MLRWPSRFYQRVDRAARLEEIHRVAVAQIVESEGVQLGARGAARLYLCSASAIAARASSWTATEAALKGSPSWCQNGQRQPMWTGQVAQILYRVLFGHLLWPELQTAVICRSGPGRLRRTNPPSGSPRPLGNRRPSVLIADSGAWVYCSSQHRPGDSSFWPQRGLPTMAT